MFYALLLLPAQVAFGQHFEASDAVPPPSNLPVIQRSSAFGDLDNDGDLDLFAPIDGTATIADPLPVMRRKDGESYTDITLDVGLTVTDAIYSNNAIWLDADRDGWLDLYVGSYWFCCIAGSPAGKAAHPTIRNRLYRNFEGTFLEDITEISGLDIRFDLIGGGTQGEMGSGDFNNDGWPDIYLGAGDTGLSHLFLNDQTGTFWEASGDFISIGVALHAFDLGDVDNDGDLDIFQTAGLDTTLASYLFTNVGEGQITDITIDAGLDDLFLSNNMDGGLIDVDNDGDLDVVVWGENGVRLNDGTGTFARPAQDPPGTTSLPAAGGFMAFDDADGDGDLDALVYSTGDAQPALFLNRSEAGHWFQFEVTDSTGRVSAIGASLTVESEGRTQRRQIATTRGVPQLSRTGHIGLGSATVAEQVDVSWPSGSTTTLQNVSADQRLRIAEEEGIVQPTDPDGIVILPPFPNPSNDLVFFTLSVVTATQVHVEIFNTLGQRMITIARQTLLPGTHRFAWDGRDEEGMAVADGVYFVRYEGVGPGVAKKILVLRNTPKLGN